MPDDRWLTATRGDRPPRREAPDALRLRQPGADPSGARRPGAAPAGTRARDVERLAGHGRPRPGAARSRDRRSTRRSPPSTRPATSPTGAGMPPGPRSTPATSRSRRGSGAPPSARTTTGPPTPRALATAREVQAALPAATPLPDRLRVAVAALRAGDPLRDDRRVAAVAARAGTLLATLVEALPPVDPRDAPSSTGSLARRLWTRVSPLEPTTRRVRALDRALSLLADHELATSTLAVRVAASAWADPYLLLLTGLATAGGPLHGGASEFVRALLRDAVATDAETAVGQRHARRPARARVRSRGLRGSRSAGAGAPRRDRGEPAAPRPLARRLRVCST